MNNRCIILSLMRRSAMSDLTSPDGEVESFSRVSWLEGGSGSPDASNPVSPAPAPVKRGRVALSVTGTAFPPHSRLLTLHSPSGEEEASPYAVCLLPNRGIAVRSTASDGVTVNVGILPADMGEITAAIPYGNVVTLVGRGGVAWLLYDAAAAAYSLLPSLPEAPDVSYSADPAHMEGYTRVAGNLPEMDLEVDLTSLASLPARDTLAAWLDAGDSSAVDKALVDLVYKEVGKRVARYCAEVGDAGLWLTPFRCVAAWGDALPSQPQEIDTGYRPPYARLASWALRGATLALHIEFSLRPYTVAATWRLSALQKSWEKVFGEVRIYTSAEVPWTLPGASADCAVEVTGFSSLADSGGRGFRFASRTRAKVLALARGSRLMQPGVGIAVAGASGGTLLVDYPVHDQIEFRPDYTDFIPPIPSGAALTDEGAVLWSGRTLLSPMKSNGVVYRYRDIICDRPLLAVVQGSLRKGTATSDRHALTLFCSDGIRRAMADGRGGYHNAQLISSVPALGAPVAGSLPAVDPSRLIAVTPPGVVFISRRGVEIVASSGNVRLLAAFPVASSGIAVTPEMIVSLHYHHQSGCVLTRTSEGDFILDPGSGGWNVVENTALTSTMDVVADGAGGLLTVEGGNTLAVIDMAVVEENTDGARGLQPTGDADRSAMLPGTGMSVIRTRPLKFGDPFVRKRIRGVTTAATGDMVIEGSDDLMSWHELASCAVPARGLHLLSCRFHRITLIFPEEFSDTLQRIAVHF